MAVKSRKKSRSRRLRMISVFLTLLMPSSIALYLYSRTYAKSFRLGVPMTDTALQSILQRSIPALIGMGVAAALIAIISLSFQTVTGSRILTPSMIGLARFSWAPRPYLSSSLARTRASLRIRT